MANAKSDENYILSLLATVAESSKLSPHDYSISLSPTDDGKYSLTVTCTNDGKQDEFNVMKEKVGFMPAGKGQGFFRRPLEVIQRALEDAIRGDRPLVAQGR